MNRRPFVLAALALALVPAASARADRADRITILSSTPARGQVLPAVQPFGTHGFAAAWAQAGAGAVRAARTGGGLQTVVVKDGLQRVTMVDLALSATGEPTVVWADGSGVWASQPFAATPAAPVQLAAGRADGVRIAKLRNGSLLVAAAIRTGTHDAISVIPGDGATWQPPVRVATAALVSSYRGFALTAYEADNFALVYPRVDKRIVVQPGTLGNQAVPAAFDLGVKDGDVAAVGTSGGGLHILYGGTPTTGPRAGQVRYALLTAGGKLTRRTLLRNLQCDSTGNLIGVGFVGTAPRLLFGYGCDVGWDVTTIAGKLAIDPYKRFPKPYVEVALASGTGAGRTAVIGFTDKGQLGVQSIRP